MTKQVGWVENLGLKQCLYVRCVLGASQSLPFKKDEKFLFLQRQK